MKETPKLINGKTLGVILVLFILVTIVTRVFSDRTQRINSTDGGVLPPIAIASVGDFYIYNQSNVRVDTTRLSGSFASPPPNNNVLYPGESYNYQVEVTANYDRNAYVRYTANNDNSRYIDMTLRTSGTPNYITIIVTEIEGFSYSLNVGSLYIKNRYAP
ncbi:hypothetical protein M3223_14715 [Paenibacillus pasadenensis]|uniref:hypothetical protein n=1 Tax=Paenibacillus pasadenensis TaxID=217090 RepID=UPI00203C86A5|nr:hypothetical protein [Paenibacillus pasadenensis]MCM3748601.1 hypothetical protein [Paenibacillus pasadenensis]